MSYTRNLQHIVFATKYRMPVLDRKFRPELYSVMGQSIKRLNCHPLIINGIEDHVHILCGVHPVVPIAELVKTVKLSATYFLKNNFPESGFECWQREYASFSFHKNLLDVQYNYVLNQEIHHRKLDSRAELLNILRENEIDYNPEYFE